MALVLKKIYETLIYVNTDLVDPNNSHKFVTTIPFIILFTATYLTLVKKIGPKFMENRPPYDIRKIIILYNVIQILINVKILYESCVLVAKSEHKICVNIGPEMYSIKNQFMVLKLVDCIETMFFVLRKSYRQISFLHVYHHWGMVLASWVANRYEVGDTSVYVPLINCFVHAIMFVYYLLTSIDPEWKKNLTLKKGLTQIQLIQFFVFVCIFLTASFLPNCNGVTNFVAYLWVIQNFFMFCLFSDFYIKAYLSPKRK